MGRIMAIDYGLKRVGLATTDPLQIIASSLTTIHPKELVKYLQNYFKNETVDCVVIGMPTRLDSTATNLTPHVIKLIADLKVAFPEMIFESHDERFTSGIALKAMIASGVSKKDRSVKGNVDMVAATVILQSYMESKALKQNILN
jgi:putative holliday junction resolvase